MLSSINPTLNIRFALLMKEEKESLPFELKEIFLLASPQLRCYSRCISSVKKVRHEGVRDFSGTPWHQGQIESDGAGGQCAG